MLTIKILLLNDKTAYIALFIFKIIFEYSLVLKYFILIQIDFYFELLFLIVIHKFRLAKKYFILILYSYILIIIVSLFSLVVEHSLSKREVIGSTPVGGL